MTAFDSDPARLRDEFIQARGCWNVMWENVLRQAPDYFEAHLEM